MEKDKTCPEFFGNCKKEGFKDEVADDRDWGQFHSPKPNYGI
jgi:hypothetical protein